MTESEVENAGFYILRSEDESGAFERRSVFVPGRGTTPFRTEYEWMDIGATPGVTYYYGLEQHDFNGSVTREEAIVSVTVDAPRAWLLRSGVPNPFNPATTFALEVPAGGDANLAVYDMNGRAIRTILSGEVSAGVHYYTWNGTDAEGRPAASGVYFARLAAAGGSIRQVQRVTLVR